MLFNIKTLGLTISKHLNRYSLAFESLSNIMNYSRLKYFLFIFIVLFAPKSYSQDKPIGYWRAHMPYNSGVGVATDGTTLYAVCNQSFFTCNNTNGDMTPYSKVEGMNDVGMQCVAYDMSTSTTILIYKDGNIDLFKDNTFYNIPDFEIKTIAGTKAVYQVYAQNGFAYLSTSIGVLVIDLVNKNIQITYQFIVNNQTEPVNGFIAAGNYFYAITPVGIYRANKNNPELQDFQMWQQIDSTHVLTGIAAIDSTVFFANSTKVFALVSDTLQPIYISSKGNITHIDAGVNQLFVSEKPASDVKIFNSSYRLIDSFTCNAPLQVTQLLDSSIWVADATGLLKRVTGNQVKYFYPNGPSDPNSYDIYAYNKNVWVAHGGFDDTYRITGDRNGVSNYYDDSWHLYTQSTYPPFADSNIIDCVSITKDQTTGNVYVGTFIDGLFILKPGGNYDYLNVQSPFAPSISYGNSNRQIVGLGIDHQNNLWVSTMYDVAHQLYVKQPDSTWYGFRLANISGVYGGPLTVDDDDQIWFVNSYGGGVGVYNTNHTLSDLTDDGSYHLTTGAGYGNLPSSDVFCIAKDNNDEIWIGTDNGIGVVNCASGYTASPCDAVWPIVQYDQFAGYLFAGYNVRSIAVDGANRKWVGTDNGVWLLSPDASQIIYQFTQYNSPLPSNYIQKIAIDPITGDVYIGTQQGLISFHSTATEGGTTNQSVTVFPNPVPSGYKGTIAIKGLVANADVRITDIDGQLVYRTTALGGQAVWNGMDYTGHRPESGVYLIFITNSDGSQTYVSKMVFMQ